MKKKELEIRLQLAESKYLIAENCLKDCLKILNMTAEEYVEYCKTKRKLDIDVSKYPHAVMVGEILSDIDWTLQKLEP